MSRFQLRRWPDSCPPLVGELAVVDTHHADRIILTYRDESCRDRGGALKASTEDIERWNVNPPTLTPLFRPREIIQHPDGTFYQVSDERPGLFYDETDRRSLYHDFEYRGLWT